LRAERLQVSMIAFTMDERDVTTVLGSPWTMIGTDGLPPGVGGRPHPRLTGTFPRVLGRYVRDRAVLTLPEAVRRMTSLPAEVFGLADRGVIRPGAIADLVALDPDRVADTGGYDDPLRPPTGLAWVRQAGTLVVDQNRWLGRRSGARLTPSPG
jgi:N-acyl-D-amino-acid deacylase